jgi:hypothetical protein
MSTVREAQVSADEAPTAAPFFIVGSGRSGTTLLRMMLCSHSRISIPGETWFLIDLLKRFSIDRPLQTAEIEGAVSIIAGQLSRPEMKLDPEEFRREVSELTQPYLRDLVEIVYQWHVRAEGKARWGDKTPVYIRILPELARMFPNSQFIFLVRDGRDVAKSFQSGAWLGPWLHNNTQEWLDALEYLQRSRRSGLGERILLVRYEDLVLETESTLQKICRFIGEEFEPEMLRWEHVVDEHVPPDQMKQRHWKLRLSVRAEAVARWRREMSAREIFVSEAFMGAHLTRLGYACRYRSPLWAPALALTRLYCRVVLNGGRKLLKLVVKAVRFPRKQPARALGAG